MSLCAGGTEPVTMLGEPLDLPQRLGGIVRRRQQEEFSFTQMTEPSIAPRIRARCHHRETSFMGRTACGDLIHASCGWSSLLLWTLGRQVSFADYVLTRPCFFGNGGMAVRHTSIRPQNAADRE